MPKYVLLMSRTTMQVSIYQSSEQQSSRVLIGSGNLEYASNSLFCDRSQDGVSFRDIFERRNLSDK